MSKSMIVNTVTFRGYLMLLHGMFVLLYAFHLELPLTALHVGALMILAAFTLVILTIPKPRLATPWVMTVWVTGDAGILFATMPHKPDTYSAMVGAVLLLLAMASYLSSVLHFALVSSLLVGGYGFLLYQQELLQTETVLLLPTLLCVTLVFLSKMGIFEAEIERLTEAKSKQPSTKDPLTGLANRTFFLEQVRRMIQYRHMNRNFQFAVLFLDLDGFKPVNDKFGHKAGDAVLRHTANLLQGCVRKGDLVGRYGGDEFTVLLNDIKSPSHAARVADNILAKFRVPIDVGEPVVVGASIGIAMSTNLHGGPEDLIRDADAAMYHAKAKGKNCYVISDESEIPKAELKARWKRVANMNWW